MKNWRNRFCSGFLAAVMLASNLPPVPVFAAAEDTGLCEHHPDHIDCSYIPAVEAVPCSHVCSEESGCVDSCLHEHDETCGYTEAQDGMECDFFCTECNISTESPGMEATAPIGGATDETVPPTASPTEETEPPMVEVPAETTSPAEEPPEETTVPETTVPTVIDSGSCGDNATWTVYSDKSLVISGTGAVTSSPWLDGYSTVYSLIVEEGITEICGHAFRNMPNLVSAQLPQSLNTIPSYSFYYDTQLKNIQFSDNVEHIGEHAFSGTGFTSFAIPDSVTSEVYNIISGANLTELYIGAGSKISETHWPSISAMPSLQNYVVSADNPYFTAVDGVLYTKDLKTLVNHPDGRAGSFSIPDGVETINSYAFNHDVNITDIHIPASVTEITENQFRFLQLEDAKSLRDIHVDDNNTAFASEDGLLYNKEKTILYCCGPGKEGTVRVAEGTWELDSYAFLRCSMLTNVLLPDSLEYIGFGAFRKCTNLQNLVIPATVTGWGQFAFQECSSLQWLATSVKNGNFQQDFENCCSLTDVYYYGTEAEWNTNRISNYDYPVKNAVKHFNAPLPGTYSISYILNEGENSPNNPATYYNYAEDIILEEPSREGYLFNGWYLESDDSAPAEAPQIRRGYSSGNMTFRAEWTEITQVYSVTLDSQGGLIHGALTEFIPGNVTPLPKDVIRNDYIFLGWYEGDTKVTEIPADAEGDKVYVAHWQEKADIAIDVTMQSYAYDGEGKTFVLKDTDGNLLPVAYGADWLVPCDYTSVAMSFGQQGSPETGASTYHQGVDLDTGTGWPVWASRAGTVVKAGSGSASGNYVQINHGDGFQSVYMHLNSFYVSAGEYVNPARSSAKPAAPVLPPMTISISVFPMTVPMWIRAFMSPWMAVKFPSIWTTASPARH